MKFLRWYLVVLFIIIGSASLNAQPTPTPTPQPGAVTTVVSTNWKAMDYVLYYGTTDKPIVFGWDASEGASSYDLVIYNKDLEIKAAEVSTNKLSYTINLPKSGHYVFKVRACKPGVGTNATVVCSDWSESIDSKVSTVGGAARGWWVYGHIAPVGNVTIK